MLVISAAAQNRSLYTWLPRDHRSTTEPPLLAQMAILGGTEFVDYPERGCFPAHSAPAGLSVLEVENSLIQRKKWGSGLALIPPATPKQYCLKVRYPASRSRGKGKRGR